MLAQSEAASRFGWSRLFDGGTLRPDRFAAAAARLWSEWLAGGWAVRLNQSNGHDVVAKDIELKRIRLLVGAINVGICSETDLIDAMLRFDAVVRPFAPFERPMSNRRRVIDMIARDCDILWPRPGNGATTPSCRPHAVTSRRTVRFFGKEWDSVWSPDSYTQCDRHRLVFGELSAQTVALAYFCSRQRVTQ